MSRKRTLRIVVIVLAALALLLAGTAIALRILFPPERIRSLVIPPLEKSLNRDVEIGRTRIELFPPVGLAARDIRIAGTRRSGFTDTALAQIDRLVVNISVWHLLKRQLRITGLTLYEPFVFIEVDSAGAHSTSDIGSPQTPGDSLVQQPSQDAAPRLPIPVTLNQLRIRDGALRYSNRQTGEELLVSEIDQDASAQIPRAIDTITTTGELEIGRFSFSPATVDSQQRKEQSALRIEHSLRYARLSDAVMIERIRASVEESFAELRGRVDSVTQGPVLDLVMESAIYPEEVVRLMPRPARLSSQGSIVTNAVIRGPLPGENTSDMPDIRGTSTSEDLVVTLPSFSKPLVVENVAHIQGDTVTDTTRMSVGRSRLTVTALLYGYTERLRAESGDPPPSLPRLVFEAYSPLVAVNEMFVRKDGRWGTVEEAVAPVHDTLSVPFPPLYIDGDIRVDTVGLYGPQVHHLRGTITTRPQGGRMETVGTFSGGRITTQTTVAPVEGNGGIAVGNEFAYSEGRIGTLTSVLRSLLPPANELLRVFRQSEFPFSGTANVTSSLTAEGITSLGLIQNLAGQALVRVTDGEIGGAVIGQISDISEEFLQQQFQKLSFSSMQARMVITEGGLQLDTATAQTPLGRWSAWGRVGLDGALEGEAQNRLPRDVSKRLLGSQQAVMDALNRMGGSSLAGQLEKGGIPADRGGRVTLRYSLGGTVQQPSVALAGFGGVGMSAADKAREEARKRAERLEREAEEKLQEQKEKLEERGRGLLDDFLR